MKILSWIKVLPVIAILFVSNSICSQVVVERSTDKVIISGTPYYIHLVKKGETAYSISRAYGITVEELTKENPPSVFGVKEGQALRIPVQSVTEVKPPETVKIIQPRDESNFIYHILKPGETVYSLSRLYGVSENEILQSNHGIDINKLSVGIELAIPKRDFMSNRQKFDEQETRYIYHKVATGESFSSIARQYGLTLRELKRENRDLRFPQVGDFIRIPGIETADLNIAEIAAPDTISLIDADSVYVMDKPLSYTPVKDLKGSFNVAVLLPFYLKENGVRIEIDSSKSVGGKKIYKKIERPEEWIYPRSLDFIEMYEGILLAADTLTSLGLDINIFPFDIKSDTVEVTRLIQSGKLSEMDIIIGPVYSHNLSKVASYSQGPGDSSGVACTSV